MGHIVANAPLGGALSLPALITGSEIVSRSPDEFTRRLPDGTEAVLEGHDFHYSPDGLPLGGTLTAFHLLDGDQVLLTADGFDLSLAASIGFLADGRAQDFVAYVLDGADTIEGSAEADLIGGFHGDDVLQGNGGDDAIDAGAGADSVSGGLGDDLVFGRADDDDIDGGAGGDLLFGNTGLDTLAGGAGDDTIYGGQNYDVLHGDVGDDLLHGDLGGDDLWGGAGNDTLVGGGGDDWFHFASESGQDVVQDFNLDDQDQIQIERGVNGTDIVDFASLAGRIAAGPDGDAVIDLGGGNTIRLVGIDADAVDERYFGFFDRSDLAPDPDGLVV
jgi:Ca2+-binding RTX toxin-like protein